MITHELKTWPQFFAAIECGNKTFEVRKNDRRYQPNDRLLLQEWDHDSQAYTGRSILVGVSYIMDGDEPDEEPKFGIAQGYVVMAIKPVK